VQERVVKDLRNILNTLFALARSTAVLSAVPLSCLTGVNVETHVLSGMLLFICLHIFFFLPFIQFLHFLPSAVLDAFAKLRKVTVSFIMSVRPSAWNNSGSIGTYFHEI
jgi:hypothetical protein